jgi:hypothetical protein
VTTQIQTVAAPPGQPAAPPPLPPAHISSLELMPQQGRLHLQLQVVAASGRPVRARVALAVLHDGAAITTASALTDGSGMLNLTPRSWLQHGCYTARLRGLSAAGYVWDKAVPVTSYCVRSLPAHVTTVSFSRRGGRLRAAVRAVDDAGRPVAGRVTLRLLRGDVRVASTVARTGRTGWVGLTAPPKHPAPGCYRVAVTRLTAAGYRWDGSSPGTRYCLRGRTA